MTHALATLSEATVPVRSAALAQAIDASLSANTKDAYMRRLATYKAWTDAQDRAPTDPATLAEYLATEGATRSDSWRAQLLAALRHVAQATGMPDPTVSQDVRLTMRGLRRIRTTPKRQAKGLTEAVIATIEATVHIPRPGRGGALESEVATQARANIDIAICRTMRDAMLRRSEAAALTWADIEQMEDGSARLTIRHSKTDQDAHGSVQYLTRRTAQALRAIRPIDAKGTDSVFGLCARRIGDRVKAAARHAGIADWRNITGHSGRVGAAQDLVARGATMPELMLAGRWASPRMPTHYARAQLAGRGAVARLLER